MTQQTRIWATGPSGEVLPVVCDAQGNLVIQLEGATVNVGDVDVASIAAGTNLIGKVGIDQVTANANEVVVKTSALPSGAATSANQILTYKGQDRTTTTGAAEEITIPSGSKRAYISCDPASKGHMNINADATTSSFYISGYRDLSAIDLLGVTKLSTWMVAGNASFLFFG